MSEIPLCFESVPVNGPGGPTLNLEIPANLAVSVLGDDASGVSQLGPLALGLQTPAAGRLTLLGTELSTLSRSELLAYRRRVGYLPAGDGLLQNLTLRQNVALPLRFGSNLSETEIESRLNIMLAAVGLGQAGHLRPAQATDEQRRRAALTRALAFDPKLVVLEEPFVGLTDLAARDILETARGGEVAAGSRRTVLAIGPNLPDSVKRRFERHYRMERGTLRQES